MKQVNINFEVLIPYKIVDIISLIMGERSLNFTDALRYLYESKLYNLLSDESTKLWHLSSEKLFDILEHEKQHNQLELPDFV